MEYSIEPTLDYRPEDYIADHVVIDAETLERWSRHRYAYGDGTETQLATYATLAEVIEALAVFGGTYALKKRRTILALVEAELSGGTEESVWKLKDTCNKSTYQNKWKKDKAFTRTLDLVRDIARKYQAAEEAIAMIQARQTIRKATAPAAVVLQNTLLSEDENTALRAAKIIIDAAGVFPKDEAAPTDPTYSLTINNTAQAAAGAAVSFEDWQAKAAAAAEQASQAEELLDFYEIEDTTEAASDADTL